MEKAHRVHRADDYVRADPSHPLYALAERIEGLLLPLLKREERRLADGFIRVVDRLACRTAEDAPDPLCVQLFLSNGSARYEWMRGNRWIRGSVSLQFVCESEQRITLIDGPGGRAWEFSIDEVERYIMRAYDILGIPYLGQVSPPP